MRNTFFLLSADLPNYTPVDSSEQSTTWTVSRCNLNLLPVAASIFSQYAALVEVVHLVRAGRLPQRCAVGVA